MRTWHDVDAGTQIEFIRQFKSTVESLAESGAIIILRPITLEERQECVTPNAIDAAELMINYKKRKRK